jgi:hypothetical protein
VTREALYLAEPWEAPAYRAPWAEPGAPRADGAAG